MKQMTRETKKMTKEELNKFEERIAKLSDVEKRTLLGQDFAIFEASQKGQNALSASSNEIEAYLMERDKYNQINRKVSDRMLCRPYTF
jgi:hypothetical protein